MVVHVCCAPCSAAIVERLVGEGQRVLVYFYNPNIHPMEEYARRLAEVVRYTEGIGVEMREGDYDAERWEKGVVGLEREKERGERCRRCIAMRLEKTAELATAVGAAGFGTSLGASRWKSLEQISAGGREAEKKNPDTLFVDRNWRRGGLSARSAELIASWGFYRQGYCGCSYSQVAAASR